MKAFQGAGSARAKARGRQWGDDRMGLRVENGYREQADKLPGRLETRLCRGVEGP